MLQCLFPEVPKMSKKRQFTKVLVYIVKNTYLGVHFLFMGDLRHFFLEDLTAQKKT